MMRMTVTMPLMITIDDVIMMVENKKRIINDLNNDVDFDDDDDDNDGGLERERERERRERKIEREG